MRRVPGGEQSREKSLVAMFAQSYKPYTFGAFGKPTTQFVRAALAAGRVVFTFNAAHTLSGAAIFSKLKAESIHKDFSHRECVL